MPTRILLVGGFLGAGKTTLLAAAAAYLKAGGYTVGTVTNDQGENLVDSALLRSHGIATTEVAGGCFCCHFPSLVSAIATLEAETGADVILAEAVGSCTDLMASVVRPLHQLYPGRFEVAPLTIALDPMRQRAQFSTEIDYLYERQLAESELIALTKCDLLDADSAARAAEQAQSAYPNAEIFPLSARTGQGVGAWVEACLSRSSRMAHDLELDYTRYTAAEGELAWLNASGSLAADSDFMPDVWVADVLERARAAMIAGGVGIAHMKMMTTGPGALSKASIVHEEAPLSWDTRSGEAAARQAEFVLNIRAAGEPATLEAITRAALAASAPGLTTTIDEFACFSPLPPTPTHRLHSGN